MNNPAASACDETFVTLCVYPKSAEIFYSVGEFSLVPPTSTSDRNGVFAWFWSTQSSVASKDVGEHLKFIVDLASQAQTQNKKQSPSVVVIDSSDEDPDVNSIASKEI